MSIHRPERGGEVRDRGIAFVLDASALLAMLHSEPGGEMVAAVLENSIVSAVNWAEVVQKAVAHGIDIDGMSEEMQALGLNVQPFSPEDAEVAGKLWTTTRSRGLSLGDRACLALAAKFEIPALTTDRAWSELDLDVEVQLAR